MSSLWTSWVRVWGWVSDRVTTDPLFVRMSHALLRLFSDGREVLGSQVACLPSWCGLCASFAQWLLPSCSLIVFTFLPFRVICSFVHCEGTSPCV